MSTVCAVDISNFSTFTVSSHEQKNLDLVLPYSVLGIGMEIINNDVTDCFDYWPRPKLVVEDFLITFDCSI